MPVMKRLWQPQSHQLTLHPAGCVGLSDGQSNSKVGHVSLGNGRIVYHDLTSLDWADGDFFSNSTLTAALGCSETFD